jgi:hypothetical protein
MGLTDGVFGVPYREWDIREKAIPKGERRDSK